MLRDCPNGGYRFLPGISAFSSGTVAMPGHEIVHVTLASPIPWRDGFARIDRHLRTENRPRTALCGIELRSPQPFTFDGFAYAELFEPQLTTVRQPAFQVGTTAAELLTKRIADKSGKPSVVRLAPTIEYRASTGPRPAS